MIRGCGMEPTGCKDLLRIARLHGPVTRWLMIRLAVRSCFSAALSVAQLQTLMTPGYGTELTGNSKLRQLILRVGSDTPWPMMAVGGGLFCLGDAHPR